MRRYKISKREAIDLQEWALNRSGANKCLDTLPEFSKKGKNKPGLYVSYEIDENELDGGIDWPTPAIATLYAVLDENRKKINIGEIRAYNFETYWLSTQKYEEVDSAENWFELIKRDYEELVRLEREIMEKVM